MSECVWCVGSCESLACRAVLACLAGEGWEGQSLSLLLVWHEWRAPNVCWVGRGGCWVHVSIAHLHNYFFVVLIMVFFFADLLATSGV